MQAGSLQRRCLAGDIRSEKSYNAFEGEDQAAVIEIFRTNCNFERELLVAPFGFKGGHTTELWQTVVLLESKNGHMGLGLGTQSVLWSDARVAAAHSEAAANSMMFATTAYALQCARSLSHETPLELLDALLPHVHEYACHLTGRPDLRLTFALNALVPVDNAAWQLYAEGNRISTFDGLIPEQFRPAFSCRHKELACIPLIAYGVPVRSVADAAEEGFFLFKIKIGADPDGDGDPEKMLRWDMDRLSAIHSAVRDRKTPYATNGHIAYYLDANGRYDSKERLMRLLDHAEAIGALDRIILLEEPFPEDCEVDVRDIPVRIAADESAHSDADAERRIQMGYRAIALKPIAKTMSMSLRIAQVAWENHVPCFTADLTVNPILVDWNKNFAARLAPLPGLEVGVLEANGHQNYREWSKLGSYHPCAGASWTRLEGGFFHLEEDFYARSGGIFEKSMHYAAIVGRR